MSAAHGNARGFTSTQIAHGEDLRWMTTIDLIDRATMKATHLIAMLEATYGGGAKSFQQMGSALQDDYLWGCSTLARELRATILELTTAERRSHDPARR